MYKIQDKLSHQHYSFIPGKRTQHCFAEYCIQTDENTHTASIDLKSASDTANREVILEQPFEFRASDRESKIYFKRTMSDVCEIFGPGTPQGGVLSPTLFNILMDKFIFAEKDRYFFSMVDACS